MSLNPWSQSCRTFNRISSCWAEKRYSLAITLGWEETGQISPEARLTASENLFLLKIKKIKFWLLRGRCAWVGLGNKKVKNLLQFLKGFMDVQISSLSCGSLSRSLAADLNATVHADLNKTATDMKETWEDFCLPGGEWLIIIDNGRGSVIMNTIQRLPMFLTGVWSSLEKPGLQRVTSKWNYSNHNVKGQTYILPLQNCSLFVQAEIYSTFSN
jgi:hypothetical protein